MGALQIIPWCTRLWFIFMFCATTDGMRSAISITSIDNAYLVGQVTVHMLSSPDSRKCDTGLHGY